MGSLRKRSIFTIFFYSVITGIHPGHHISGGELKNNFTFQIGVIHITLEIKKASMCYLACDIHPGCAGFDWNIERATCWFHMEEEECSQDIIPTEERVVHFRMEACGKHPLPRNDLTESTNE